MDDWASVGRCLGRLKSSNFESEVGECGGALTSELVVCWRRRGEEFSWDREALSKHEIRWGCADVWLNSCPYGQHGARQAPEPTLRLLCPERYQRLLQPAMEALYHPVRFGMVGSRHDRLDSPCSSQLLKDL